MKPQPGSNASRSSIWVPVVLFLVAAGIAANPLPFVSPVPLATRVPDWATDPTPIRQPTLKPTYRLAGFEYVCSDCHRLMPSPAITDRPLTQHTEIELKHGINTACFNCHHRANRDAFAGDLGVEIAWNQPQLLCAKCHGPVYRDWQNGAHGRSNGYWDRTAGEHRLLKCIECHDPHQPAFPPMHPAPPPNTLRMGPQDLSSHAEERDPLRVHTSVPPTDSHPEAH